MNKTILINLRLLQNPYTGVQSYVYNLVKALVQASPKTEFRVAVFSYDGKNEYIEDLLANKNVSLENIPGHRNIFTEILFDHLYVLKAMGGVGVYFSPVNILPLFRKKDVKYVVGVLDLCTFIVPETTTRQLKLYYDLVLSPSLKRADQIITISDNTKKDLRRLFKLDKAKITTIPLGVDEDTGKSSHITESQIWRILKKIHLNEEDKYFLTAGTSIRKNVDSALKAFDIFCETKKDAKLVIVVKDPEMIDYIGALLKKTKHAGKVILTGRYITKTELMALYTKAIAFVYCSYYEGFGLPVLEAMQNKCPVIASNTSSLPEVVGASGILVDPLDTNQISDAMHQIDNDHTLRSELIKKGLEKVKEFSWAKTAGRLLHILDKVI